MSERTGYEPGTPSWVDLSTPDLEGALEFYGGLFGWRLEDAGEEAGHYHEALVRGRRVAGIGPAQQGGPPMAFWTTYLSGTDVGGIWDMTGQMPDDFPPNWTAYFHLDDVDAGFERARQLGGDLLDEPRDSPYGRWATLRDPQGGTFRLIKGATTQ